MNGEVEMKEITVTQLAELRVGDVLTALDGKPYKRPLTVANSLGPIEPGSPVHGVRFVAPVGSEIEWVFYPSQIDGHTMSVSRA
ncbi:hypothetical protein JSO19_00150 [Leucobacter sp. UCMA 4100]|uniref:hypothetical protein n=1 Tax=Leucobacter sp. UCMA 4100 TaxID=2810534 RepID=UPI0022EA8464|nr:hypothetical protein [Leucobacter sp. UCMA 4100]MDA3145789.1 hypothetical protein [Leucobacter sp. UCMA 4100]